MIGMSKVVPGRAARLAPLAAAVFALLGLPAAAQASPVTHVVANCNDSGDGSLRDTIAAAASGDTVDYSGLSNCTISLTTGSIPVGQLDLHIEGNADVPIIGASNAPGKRLILHTGTGTLSLSHVTMGYNVLETVALPYGGCIATAGSVAIYHSELSHCVVNANAPLALGGAVMAFGNVKLVDTKILSSQVNPAAGKFAYGGAVYARGQFESDGATLAGNSADAAVVGYAIGGGVVAKGGMTIRRSTISSNSAGLEAGAMFAGGGTQFHMYESTVSGNSASRGGGIVIGDVSDVWIDNSTIAFNSETSGSSYAAGLGLAAVSASIAVRMRSTLIANNYAGADARDFSIYQGGAHTVTIDPASGHDLIRSADSGTAIPAGTLTGVCPRLGPLRNNGGTSFTHALNTGSAAIDAGANPNADAYDQRDVDPGSAQTYPRESPTGLPDIGAYEVDQSDIVFTSDNEGCAALPGG